MLPARFKYHLQVSTQALNSLASYAISTSTFSANDPGSNVNGLMVTLLKKKLDGMQPTPFIRDKVYRYWDGSKWMVVSETSVPICRLSTAKTEDKSEDADCRCRSGSPFPASEFLKHKSGAPRAVQEALRNEIEMSSMIPKLQTIHNSYIEDRRGGDYL